MAERPRYLSLPARQKPVFDDSGTHVGYRVAVKFQKNGHEHEEAAEVVVGPEEASRLAAASPEEFTAWNKEQVEAHGLVEKANAALDKL